MTRAMHEHTATGHPPAGLAPGVTFDARISASGGPGLLLDLGTEQGPARRAFSCLVEPETGDRVLCARASDGTVYVLAVLERRQGADMRLLLPGNAEVDLPEGVLTLRSARGMAVQAPELSTRCGKARLSAEQGVLDCGEVTARATRITATVETLRLVCGLAQRMARQALESFSLYARTTRTMDSVKAGTLNRAASGLSTLEAEHTMIDSRGCTRVDGKKILMG